MIGFNFVSENEREEFKKVFTRSYPLSHLFFQLNSLEKYWKEFFKTKTNFSEVLRMINHENGKTDTYFNVRIYLKLLDEIKTNLKEDSSYFKYILKKTKDELNEAKELAKNKENYINKIKKDKPLETINTFLDYYDKCYKITVISWSFDVIGDALIKRLIEELEKNGRYDEINIQSLLSEGIRTIFGKEKLAFLGLCKKIKESGNENLLKEHLEKWAFIGMENPIARPFTLEDLKMRYKHIREEHIDEEIKRMDQTFKKEIKKINSLIFNLPEEIKKVAEEVRVYMSYKNNERILLQKYVFDSLSILFKIFEVYELPIEDYGFIFENEEMEIIKGNLSKEELIKRIELRKNKKYKVELKDSIKTVEEYNEKGLEIKTKKVLTGLIANKGIVKGRVKIIDNLSQDFNKFEKGDILVTHMTTPNFVPLIEKASAIITDEGGILCHAAIVSREFGIPCIVGTKNATSVLKDGLSVEVIADKEGVISILEENKNVNRKKL